jgi:hypothetical protein
VPQEWLADAHRAAVSLHEKGYKTAAMELYRLCIDELEKAHGAAPRHQEVFVDERAIRITADQSTSININQHQTQAVWLRKINAHCKHKTT